MAAIFGPSPRSWQEIASKFLLSQVPPGSAVLVAISGGPDSVALGYFLKSFPYRVLLGHVDHGLRKGSGRDARFVQSLAKIWDLPCRVEQVEVIPYAKRCHLSIEEAARDLRYQALTRMARKAGRAFMLTAHTANDQAETVLMNFLRGAGPAGLAGIPPTRILQHNPKLLLLRPFLHVNRNEINTYLREYKLPSRCDPTNRSLQFSRNRIRRETLPYLDRMYPGLLDRLCRAADIFREEEDRGSKTLKRYMSKTVRNNGQRLTVALPRLLGYHKSLSRRILRAVLPGVSFQGIERIINLARSSQRTGQLRIAGGWQVRRRAHILDITRTPQRLV